ncbi:MAG: ABC transporter substrate-binding protein, partial [Cyanobacteria bacterium P01_H01_bin.121]
MRRRDLLRHGVGFTAGVSLASLLKACGGSNQSSTTTTEGATSSATSSGTASGEEAVLTVVRGGGFPNGLDLHKVGTNRPSYGTSWNIYDRLVTFGTKTMPDGSMSYDYTVIEPELAESWDVA